MDQSYKQVETNGGNRQDRVISMYDSSEVGHKKTHALGFMAVAAHDAVLAKAIPDISKVGMPAQLAGSTYERHSCR